MPLPELNLFEESPEAMIVETDETNPAPKQ
jgi:hypothetical protein